jgi:general L-amino acid transport system substrate-binding protein
MAPDPSHAASQTLDAVKKRGELLCGTGLGNRRGFASTDSQGRWQGFDVDYCKAIAAATLGDASKVKYIALSDSQRFPAIQSGEIDVLANVTTWTLTRDTDVGLDFAPPTFYTGLAMMVHKDSGVKSASQLDGATVCVFPGTTSERNTADFFRANKMTYKPVVIDSPKQQTDAYLSKRCDVMAMFAPGLGMVRAFEAPNPEDHILLPEFLAKEPLAPAVRHGDSGWKDIVSWVIFATFAAEEYGITSKNVDEVREADPNPQVQRILGKVPGGGKSLGLEENWAYNLIKQVGNYEEIFDRNVGKDSAIKMDRGLNKPWTKGGLLYAPPFF